MRRQLALLLLAFVGGTASPRHSARSASASRSESASSASRRRSSGSCCLTRLEPAYGPSAPRAAARPASGRAASSPSGSPAATDGSAPFHRPPRPASPRRSPPRPAGIGGDRGAQRLDPEDLGRLRRPELARDPASLRWRVRFSLVSVVNRHSARSRLLDRVGDRGRGDRAVGLGIRVERRDHLLDQFRRDAAAWRHRGRRPAPSRPPPSALATDSDRVAPPSTTTQLARVGPAHSWTCPGGQATTIERPTPPGKPRATTRPSACLRAARRPSGRRLRASLRSRRPR